MKHIHAFENFLNERSDGGWVGTQIYRKEDKKEFTVTDFKNYGSYQELFAKAKDGEEVEVTLGRPRAANDFFQRWQTFESFSNESVTEAEVLLFDEVGPELEAFRSKIEKLINKSTDDKWIIALKKTMSSLDRLENDLAKADNKLGVVPVTEQLDEAIYLDKLHEFGLQDAANIKAADAAIKKARLPLIKHISGGITYFMFAKEDLDKAVKAVEQVIDKSKEDEWS